MPRDFHPDAAALDTRWCGDITYIATDEGCLYLATVIDITSRRVFGWATATREPNSSQEPSRPPAGPAVPPAQ